MFNTGKLGLATLLIAVWVMFIGVSGSVWGQQFFVELVSPQNSGQLFLIEEQETGEFQRAIYRFAAQIVIAGEIQDSRSLYRLLRDIRDNDYARLRINPEGDGELYSKNLHIKLGDARKLAVVLINAAQSSGYELAEDPGFSVSVFSELIQNMFEGYCDINSRCPDKQCPNYQNLNRLYQICSNCTVQRCNHCEVYTSLMQAQYNCNTSCPYSRSK